MSRRTKIVCTLGPAVDSSEKIRDLMAAGMNVARINCSHGDWESRKKWIGWIREMGPLIAPVGILIDLQGPKFRIGDLLEGSLEIPVGAHLLIGPGLGAQIPVNQPEVLAAFSSGARVLLGDGDLELKLGHQKGSDFECRAESAGTVKSRQGVTVVGVSFECTVLTPKDLEDIREAAGVAADFIALSYVHSAGDMDLLRYEVNKLDSKIRLCAKIETKAGLKNIGQIVEKSDAIMVARGDMGLQMDMEEVPLAQKKIIATCQRAGKPVITATQMLESMMHSPRPTRAEATDIANAILDGTDAVMLSGETAAGDYPIESVATMARIAERAESIYPHGQMMRELCMDAEGYIDPTEAVAHGVAQIAELIHAKAIVTTTSTGRTARLVSKFRPKEPILCATWDGRVQAQMAVVWGVEAIRVEPPKSTDEQISHAVDGFKHHKRLKANDRVIISAGVPPGTSGGRTNMILVHNVPS